MADCVNQVGADIEGEAAGDQEGKTIALGGGMLALGSSRHASNQGHVRIFGWDSSAYVQLPTIEGSDAGDMCGAAVALSENGRVAIGAPQHDDGNGVNDNRGQARVYEYVNTLGGGQTWNPLGAALIGDTAGGSFGATVALSADGGILAVGAPWARHSGVRTGRVRLFTYSASNLGWNQLGQSLDGAAPNDSLGTVRV